MSTREVFYFSDVVCGFFLWGFEMENSHLFTPKNTSKIIPSSDLIFKISQTTKLTKRVSRNSFSDFELSMITYNHYTTHSNWLWSCALTNCLLRLISTYVHAHTFHLFGSQTQWHSVSFVVWIGVLIPGCTTSKTEVYDILKPKSERGITDWPSLCLSEQVESVHMRII